MLYFISFKCIFTGIKLASSKLRRHYIDDLLEVLIHQPLSNDGEENSKLDREDFYVDLMVLDSSVVDKEFSSSDREYLISKKFEKQESIELNKIIQRNDEAVYIRGVGGTGKTTLLEMYALRWAKKCLGDIDDIPSFDFLFLFTCREINSLLADITTVEELLCHKYPEVFEIISLSDLESISDRVLVIVDGLDELQDIYDMHKMSKISLNLDLISSLIDTKKGIWKNHKVIACGRPKACEFVKQQFDQNSKTVEVCGFNEENIVKYIDQFFNQKEDKAEKVKEALVVSNNLKVMATVPVFLWVICSVYGEELITKPLNTYTELYTYASLIFLRNHFRGKSQQHNMSLFDVLGNEEIMNSVYALMTLSVQTYMQNKVLFTEDDIKQLTCPTHLEKTGFIVRYKRNSFRKPVYQFKHLVLQEFFCGLSLCVTKWVSPYLRNRELSSCTPVIFGIHRLLNEGENELFISFFNKVSKINHLEMPFFTKHFVMPFRNHNFRKYLSQNRLEIPDCMIIGDVLVINASIPECQEFMTLLFESRFKIECPFTSSEVAGDLSATDYRNALYLLEALKLKLKITDAMVDRETLVINRTSVLFARFVFEGIGIDMKNYKLTKFRIDIYVENRKLVETILRLIKVLNINKIEVPSAMVYNENILLIDEKLRNCLTFVKFDHSHFTWSVPRQQFEFAEVIYCKDEASGIADFIQRTKLSLKLPSCMVSNGVFYLKLESKVIHSFMRVFERFKEDDFPPISTSGIFYLKCSCQFYINSKRLQRLVEKILLSDSSLKYILPTDLVNGNEFTINSSQECVNTMRIVRLWKSPLNIELLYARIISVNNMFFAETSNFLSSMGIKIRIPEIMIEDKMRLTIDYGEKETRNFISYVKDLRADKSMLDFDDSIQSALVIGHGTEKHLSDALYILKSLNLHLKIPFQDNSIKGTSEFVADPSTPKNYNFMWLTPKLRQPLSNIKIKLMDYEIIDNHIVYDFYQYAQESIGGGFECLKLLSTIENDDLLVIDGDSPDGHRLPDSQKRSKSKSLDCSACCIENLLSFSEKEKELIIQFLQAESIHTLRLPSKIYRHTYLQVNTLEMMAFIDLTLKGNFKVDFGKTKVVDVCGVYLESYMKRVVCFLSRFMDLPVRIPISMIPVENVLKIDIASPVCQAFLKILKEINNSVTPNSFDIAEIKELIREDDVDDVIFLLNLLLVKRITMMDGLVAVDKLALDLTRDKVRLFIKLVLKGDLDVVVDDNFPKLSAAVVFTVNESLTTTEEREIGNFLVKLKIVKIEIINIFSSIK